MLKRIKAEKGDINVSCADFAEKVSLSEQLKIKELDTQISGEGAYQPEKPQVPRPGDRSISGVFEKARRMQFGCSEQWEIEWAVSPRPSDCPAFSPGAVASGTADPQNIVHLSERPPEAYLLGSELLATPAKMTLPPLDREDNFQTSSLNSLLRNNLL